MHIRTLIPTAFLAAFLNLAAVAQGPVVHTNAGDVSGITTGDHDVVSFKGIPFAAPPVGNLRWAPPTPAQPWKGVRPAAAFAASCMQREHGEMLPWTQEYLDKNQTSEDCLYLNVWTPKLSATANLPVLVYIHGGAFTEGSGAVPIYDGTHLAATGLVVVTINYRLGIFGFFAHPELTAESPHHSSGNYGLMDQIAALAWVQENIANFGGDPHRVTIWGQSAGAMSVHDLLYSPLAAGLFQRAMADSGISLSVNLRTREQAEQAGAQFGTAHNAATLAALRAMPAADLLNDSQGGPMRFSPIVDGWVLPAALDAQTARAQTDVPVITGYQANDGLLFTMPLHTLADYNSLAQRQYGELAEEFERLYPAKTLDEAKQALIESIRDRDRVSMFLWASRRVDATGRPVYTYYFDRAIPWPQHPEFGAFHSGELPYFFLNLNVLNRPWTATDRALARICAAYLKNFAETGNPNGATNDTEANKSLPEWDGVRADAPSTMELGAHRESMPLAEKPRLDFWVRYFNSPASKNAPPF